MPVIPFKTSAPPQAGKILDVLLTSTESENYEAFLAPGTERFQRGISKAMFYGVSEQVASRLKAGYTAQYLTELKQGDHRIFLWKISFSDAGKEFAARLTLADDGKVAGFLLN